MTAVRPLVAALLSAALGCSPHVGHPPVQAEQVDAQIQDDAPAAFASLTAAYDRTLRIAERLRLANVGACADQVAPSLGWIAMSERDFGGLEMRQLAGRFLTAGKVPVVVAVAPEGGASKAGVQIGDHVRSLGGARAGTAIQVTRAEEELADKDAIVVERDGAELNLPVTPTRVCRTHVQPDDWPSIGVWQKGTTVYVSLRLIELATDDQLAFAIAHGMAEQLMGVDPERTDLYVPEPEATALAVQLSERAGFSVADVEPLLRLQAVEEPWTVITTRNPLANPYWAPKGDTRLGEIPRRIVALRSVHAQR